MATFYELSLMVEEEIYNENLASFAATLMARASQFLPGNTPEEKAETALDTINTVLDGVGIADPSGIADGVNTILYALRAATAKTPDVRNKNLYNALISAVSVIPFGDLAKLLKARKYTTGAKMAVQYGRPLRNLARTARDDRYNNNLSQLLPQWGRSFTATNI